MPSEYRAVWTTPGGGTGYSVFHWLTATSAADAQAQANATRALFDTLKGWLPDEVSISFENEVVVLDAAGGLLSVYGVTPPATVTGINGASYNRAAGIRIDWTTGAIVAGRRLNGRTYFVPTASTTFSTLGVVASGDVTAGRAAANTFISSSSGIGQLCVWSRAHGVMHAVTGAAVPTKGAILRGRRD